jgi:hypothetical protein
MYFSSERICASALASRTSSSTISTLIGVPSCFQGHYTIAQGSENSLKADFQGAFRFFR